MNLCTLTCETMSGTMAFSKDHDVEQIFNCFGALLLAIKCVNECRDSNIHRKTDYDILTKTPNDSFPHNLEELISDLHKKLKYPATSDTVLQDDPHLEKKILTTCIHIHTYIHTHRNTVR